MRFVRLSAVGGALLLAASTAFADVHLTMHDGRVSIIAKDATLRQILTEWARVGQTKIVNIDKIPGGPISLELTNVPEQQALDVLLRSLSGYMAAPRSEVAAANLSTFDRIIVMPNLASAPPPPMSAPPMVVQQQMMPQPAETDIAEPPAAAVNSYSSPQGINGSSAHGQGQRPGFMTASGSSHSQPAIVPTGFPGSVAPAGVSVPGTVAQPRQSGGSGIVLPQQTPGQEIALQPSQFRRLGK